MVSEQRHIAEGQTNRNGTMLTFKPLPVYGHAHCYGWDYIIHKLYKILPQDEAGIIIDDFVDSFFLILAKNLIFHLGSEFSIIPQRRHDTSTKKIHLMTCYTCQN
jgi:hypothetical protein